MKLLTLIRHAKAETPFDCSDFDRPLSPRGEADIIRVADRYNPAKTPQKIIVSSAKRAMSTAESLIRSRHYPDNILHPDRSLYSADSNQLIQLLSSQEEHIEHLALIGHNPTISELATSLSGEIIHFTPATIVTFELNIDDWLSVSAPCGNSCYQDSPSNI
ncbi:histidine phosphatase family protein [Motiliproteus sp. MSK22-1]|uniref:SixA phosphatase family protein n=1 Tax=Motiliproteus sp. MSK22-1 TaxID=1897630 RepID=UPI000978AE1F|nr:histidine phosphatase family protein [Motiliproteus sp. MSK22-1]OMH39060.1 hypothetical protein BGP75_04920 [Motiliproteus sp. MSK22-1]